MAAAHEGPVGPRDALGAEVALFPIDQRLRYLVPFHSVDETADYLRGLRAAGHRLAVLADDRSYFPRYDAVLLYRADLPTRLPRTWAALRGLGGRLLLAVGSEGR